MDIQDNGRALERFLGAIVEHLPAMVFVKDARDLRFIHFNRAGEELLGITRDRMIGKTDHDFFPAEQADFFVAKDREVLRRGTLEDIPEEPIETPRGTRWLHTRKIPILDDAGNPLYLLGISIDITERREAAEEERREAAGALARVEDQLRHSQRMEAIGRLAGGIAHDFNNLMTVVLGYADLSLKKIPPGDPLRPGIEEIRRAGARASDLTRQLLAFSRQQVLQPVVFDMREAIRGMEGIFRRVLGEDIAISTRIAGEPLWVRADQAQIEQVLMNLVVNARDAMPDGGTLTVEAGLSVPSTAPGQSPHVRLVVRDSGIGMDAVTRALAFEPFFSTKAKDKGTGLGLSTAFGIIRQSGGRISVESAPGQGAAFEIILPLAVPDDPAGRRSESVPGEFRGTETILLVEDEDSVRLLMRRFLERFGYRVLTASRPSEALALAGSERAGLHLLVTDVVMPGMNGLDLADRLHATLPALRVIYMSGYTDDRIVRRRVIEAGLPFLQKPVSEEALAALVRRVLDARA
ncbi:MAG: PAS domain-containing protein [Candidatus Brocadiae bacterium]|nr:PAS domain-containing protein [Candidatus Brocadiia bacterium]